MGKLYPRHFYEGAPGGAMMDDLADYLDRQAKRTDVSLRRIAGALGEGYGVSGKEIMLYRKNRNKKEGNACR